MRHEPDLGGYPRDSREGRGWLKRLLRRGDGIPHTLPAGRGDDASLIAPAEPADLAVLATQLSELIGHARARVDGAVCMIDSSAGEAAAYGRALAIEADAIGARALPPEAVASLLAVTRAMIERTENAEQRLRATNGELRTLQRELSIAQECAERDPLTGLLNRRALEQALAQAVETARATEAALSVAFCDIDHFKRLNDVHGHAVGDRVLRVVADSLADEAGEGIYVGRQGGEEFVMLFEGTGTIEAAAHVDAIRAALAARSLRSRSDGTPIGSVTFSAGVAGLMTGESGEEMLARADRALYRAKDDGRNQVVIDTGD